MDIPINQVVNVNISISAGGAQEGDFGLACIVGTSNTLTPQERVASFANMPEVSGVYSTATEEWKQANTEFSQNPAPPQVLIGRWINVDVAGYFLTDVSTTILSTLIGISDGSFKITINGVVNEINGLDLTSVLSWADVAAVLQTGIRAIATGGYTLATVQAIVSAGGVKFLITSGTAGVGSTVSEASPDSTGTDLAVPLGLDVGTEVDGADSETAVEAVQAIQAINDSFFGLLFTNALRDTSAVLDVAAYVQGLPKTYFTVTNDINTLDPTNTTSMAYQSKVLGYSHTMFIYTSFAAQYPDASIMSYMFTVDFLGVNTVKNAKFAGMPGITAVSITSAQLNALQAVNCNTIISIKGASFFSDGRMSGDESAATYYFDTMHFQYWQQDFIQTNVLNLFLSTPLVPYSDVGVQMEVQVLNNSLQQGVINGGLSALAGPNNTTIPAYTVLPPARVATVPSSQRVARTSPDIQFTANGSDAINRVTINGVLTA